MEQQQKEKFILNEVLSIVEIITVLIKKNYALNGGCAVPMSVIKIIF